MENAITLTQDEIALGNRKIIIFMKTGDKESMVYSQCHKNWSALMPVVAKIKKLLIGDVASGSFIPENRINQGLFSADIMTAWKGIIDYVDYYNTKIKN